MYNIAHPSLSSQYKLLTFDSIVSQAREAGFELESLRHSKGKRGVFGRYIAFFKPQGAAQGDGPRLVVINSNDGTRALRIHLGYFRAVCENGAVFGERLMPSIRSVHVGEGFYTNVKAMFVQAAKYLPIAEDFKNSLAKLQYTQETLNRLVYDALRIREPMLMPLNMVSGMSPVRREDEALDGWTIYQLLQEKLVRGGYRLDEGKKKKPLTSPTEILRVNKELSDLMAAELSK